MQTNYLNIKQTTMKKLITISLLVAATFTVNAQQMNFDETVKYINDKIDCCGKEVKNELKAQVNGTLVWGNNNINMFDLKSYKGVEVQFILKKYLFSKIFQQVFFQVNYQCNRQM